MKIRSVLDGTVHEVTGQTWLHNIADTGRFCPCRPDIRRGIVVHHRNVILEAEGREVIRRAVARVENAIKAVA